MTTSRVQHVFWGVIVSLGLSPLMAATAVADDGDDLDRDGQTISVPSGIERIHLAIESMNARAVHNGGSGEVTETGEVDPGTLSGQAAWLTYNAGPGGILDGDGCSISVALVGAEQDPARFTDVTDKIISDSRIASVTAINAIGVTPSLAELNAFDAVMVWSNSTFQNSVLLGNNLANYVDGGGGVVLTMFAAKSFDPRLMWDVLEEEP